MRVGLGSRRRRHARGRTTSARQPDPARGDRRQGHHPHRRGSRRHAGRRRALPDLGRAHGGRGRLRRQAVARGRAGAPTTRSPSAPSRSRASTCRAVAEYAFRTAAQSGARVYGGPKWTVSPVYEGMLKEELDAAAARHPDVAYQPVLIDATYAGLITGAADGPLVIPALNRDGDCLSDLVLPMFGSIAGAESVLLAFDDELETQVAMAEAPHGTAPALRARTSPTRWRCCSPAARLSTPPPRHAGAERRRARSTSRCSSDAAGVRTPDLGGAAGRRVHRRRHRTRAHEVDIGGRLGGSVRPAHRRATPLARRRSAAPARCSLAQSARLPSAARSFAAHIATVTVLPPPTRRSADVHDARVIRAVAHTDAFDAMPRRLHRRAAALSRRDASARQSAVARARTSSRRGVRRRRREDAELAEPSARRPARPPAHPRRAVTALAARDRCRTRRRRAPAGSHRHRVARAPAGRAQRSSTVRRIRARRTARTRRRRTTTKGRPGGRPFDEETGGVLLSRALAGQVPSALRGLTALFGMGRGVSPSP